MGQTDILDRLGLKADKPVIVTSKHDFEGNGMTVVVQGNENDSKLDQTISAAKMLIGNAYEQTCDDIEDDRLGDYQSLIPILDEVGALIRSNLPYTYKGINLELVKEYIEWFMRDDLHKSPDFVGKLDQVEE